MTKKFCKTCDKEIEEGKEIKIEKGLEWTREDKYERRRSISGENVYLPTEIAIYYLCRECYRVKEQKIRSTPKDWNWVVWPIIFVCLMILWALSLWQDWKK